MAKTLELERFQEADFALLNSHVRDPKFLLQWAGPKYQFPLTYEQISFRDAKTIGSKKAVYVFKAMEAGSNRTIGFIELVIRDYIQRTAIVESVLIYDEYRGKGFGKQLARAIIHFAFADLGMDELLLGVFDFNKPAIACYKDLGFEQIEIINMKSPFEDTIWNSLIMSLPRSRWKQ
jgi:RimJ/RimL family protein N-acetyltransferase